MNVGIIGGGYAGRMALSRLRRAGHDVTLVDPGEHWVERTRLHQAAATGRSVRHPHRRLVAAAGARFHQGRVLGIDGSTLHIDDGSAVRFDRVVLAAGSVPDRCTPGVREHALALGSPDEAATIRARLGELPPGGRVVVVGAGLTGLELATEVAESHPHLRLALIGDPCADLPPRGARVVRRALERLEVEVEVARVHEVHADGLETDGGARPADLVLWCAGMRAPEWLEAAGLPVDGTGRVQVDAALRVVGHPAVIAAGDCAATGLRMACATAMPLGCHAADTLIREARGLAPRPFRFGFLQRCVSLGRRRGLVQLTDAADRPRPVATGGPLAIAIKETILHAAVRLPRWEATTGVSWFGWPRGPRDQISSTTNVRSYQP